MKTSLPGSPPELSVAAVLQRLRGAASTIAMVKQCLLCTSRRTEYGRADLIHHADLLESFLDHDDGLNALIRSLESHRVRRVKKRYPGGWQRHVPA